jgi:hypothetical protein
VLEQFEVGWDEEVDAFEFAFFVVQQFGGVCLFAPEFVGECAEFIVFAEPAEAELRVAVKVRKSIDV